MAASSMRSRSPRALDLEAHDAAHRRRRGGGDQGREVMLADQAGAGRAHRREVERACHVIGIARQQGAAFATVQDGVDVRPLERREACRKIAVYLSDVANAAVAGQ